MRRRRRGFASPRSSTRIGARLAKDATDFTDDASLAEWAGIEVALVHGSSRNMKITHAEDLAMAERLLTR